MPRRLYLAFLFKILLSYAVICAPPLARAQVDRPSSDLNALIDRARAERARVGSALASEAESVDVAYTNAPPSQWQARGLTGDAIRLGRVSLSFAVVLGGIAIAQTITSPDTHPDAGAQWLGQQMSAVQYASLYAFMKTQAATTPAAERFFSNVIPAIRNGSAPVWLSRAMALNVGLTSGMAVALISREFLSNTELIACARGLSGLERTSPRKLAVACDAAYQQMTNAETWASWGPRILSMVAANTVQLYALYRTSNWLEGKYPPGSSAMDAKIADLTDAGRPRLRPWVMRAPDLALRGLTVCLRSARCVSGFTFRTAYFGAFIFLDEFLVSRAVDNFYSRDALAWSWNPAQTLGYLGRMLWKNPAPEQTALRRDALELAESVESAEPNGWFARIAGLGDAWSKIQAERLNGRDTTKELVDAYAATLSEALDLVRAGLKHAQEGLEPESLCVRGDRACQLKDLSYSTARFAERSLHYRQFVLLSDMANAFAAWNSRVDDFTKTYADASAMAAKIGIFGSLRAPLVRFRDALAAAQGPSPDTTKAAEAGAQRAFALARSFVDDENVRLESDDAAVAAALPSANADTAQALQVFRDRGRARKIQVDARLRRLELAQEDALTAIRPSGLDASSRSSRLDAFLDFTLHAGEDSFSAPASEQPSLLRSILGVEADWPVGLMPTERFGRNLISYVNLREYALAHFACGDLTPVSAPRPFGFLSDNFALGGQATLIEHPEYRSQFVRANFLHLRFIPPRLTRADYNPCADGAFKASEWDSLKGKVKESLYADVDQAAFDGTYNSVYSRYGFPDLTSYAQSLKSHRLKRARDGFRSLRGLLSSSPLAPIRGVDGRFYPNLVEYALDNLRPELVAESTTENVEDPRFLSALAAPMNAFWRERVARPTFAEWSILKADFSKLVRNELIPKLTRANLVHCRIPDADPNDLRPCTSNPHSFKVFDGVLQNMRSEAEEYFGILRFYSRVAILKSMGDDRSKERVEAAKVQDLAFWNAIALPFLNGFALDQTRSDVRFKNLTVVDDVDGSAGRYIFSIDKQILMTLYQTFGIDERDMAALRMDWGRPRHFQGSIDDYWTKHAAESRLSKAQAKAALSAIFGLERLMAEKLFYVGWMQTAELGAKPSTEADFQIDSILGAVLSQLRSARPTKERPSSP